MSYICIVAALEQIGQFVFLLKKSIFEAFQVSKSLMCTAHDNQYTSADELSNLHTVYQNRDTLFWTLAYKRIIPQETFSLWESMSHHCPNYYLQYKQISIEWFVREWKGKLPLTMVGLTRMFL